MTVKVAINGFGRMGKLVLRAAFDHPDFEIIHVNEIKGGVECAAHLLEFDTVQGRWDREVSVQDGRICVGDRRISFSEVADPAAIDWAGLGVDMVLECTGKFKTTDAVQPYCQRGVKKVVVAAPVKTGGALNIVYGVNHHLYDGSQDLVTAASCTTNCLAPVVKVLQDHIGIDHGMITTIHDVTNTQVMVDMPHKDLRRARSGLNALIPTTTGSATAITIIYPELKGRLNGHAVRVPTLNGSLTDCVFEMKRPVTEEEVNGLFAAAAEGELKGILGYEAKPLVSSDFVGDARSTIIDGPSTMVVQGTQLKIYAWYDNEWGYVNRLSDVAGMVARSL